MKKGIIICVALFAMGLYVMGCGSGESTTDTPLDTPADTPPDSPPDTPADVVTDRPDITIDNPTDNPTDNPIDNPIEIIPDGTGAQYGTLSANFTSAYLLDGARISDSAYLQAHPTAVSNGAAFTGTYDTGKTIPAAGAAMTLAAGIHVAAAGTTPAAVIADQQSYSDTTGTTLNPWARVIFASDAITPGNYTVALDTTGTALVMVYNLMAGNQICALALGHGGTINVTAASNTTAIEAGTLSFTGTNIPLYHPTDTPIGDVTSQLGTLQVCPRE